MSETGFRSTTFGLGHPWFETLMELRREEFPSTYGLQFGLASNEPVPREVRDFLGKWVAGEVSLGGDLDDADHVGLESARSRCGEDFAVIGTSAQGQG